MNHGKEIDVDRFRQALTSAARVSVALAQGMLLDPIDASILYTGGFDASEIAAVELVTAVLLDEAGFDCEKVNAEPGEGPRIKEMCRKVLPALVPQIAALASAFYSRGKLSADEVKRVLRGEEFHDENGIVWTFNKWAKAANHA